MDQQKSIFTNRLFMIDIIFHLSVCDLYLGTFQQEREALQENEFLQNTKLLCQQKRNLSPYYILYFCSNSTISKLLRSAGPGFKSFSNPNEP